MVIVERACGKQIAGATPTESMTFSLQSINNAFVYNLEPTGSGTISYSMIGPGFSVGRGYGRNLCSEYPGE